MEEEKRRELKVLKLINQNRNWEEILSSSPYNIIIKHKGDFVLLKYSQVEPKSDMSLDIVQECRGLILKKDNIELLSNPPIQQYKVASMRFTKFFNYGQEEAAKLEFPCEASEKIDGSLIGVWYDDKTGWHVSTSGNIDAEDAPVDVGEYTSYRDIFDEAWGDIDFNILNKECTYMFELVSPYTKLVVPYSETKLYLLSIRNNKTLDEFDRSYIPTIAQILFGDKIKTPKSFICNSVDEIKMVTDKMTDKDENFEGFVLCDSHFNRIKLKSALYTELFFIRGEGVFSNKKILKIILDEQDDDILAYFPEYTEQFDKVRHKLCLYIDDLKHNLSNGEKMYKKERKEFAEWAKTQTKTDLLFRAYGCNYWEEDEEFKYNFLKKYIELIPISKLDDLIWEETNE